MNHETIEITRESIISRREGLLATDLSEQEMVLLNIEQGAYFAMERVAKQIWELLAEPRRLSDLCEALIARFEVDRETCEREVLAFVTNLHARKLIVLDSPSGNAPTS